MLILELFTTAKLVTMTSRTRNGSRSVAANDVSSCVFILPCTTCHLRSYLLVCVCHYTTHHVHYTDPCLLSVQWFCVVKKKKNFMVDPYLTSILSIMLHPSVTCIINMGSLIFDCHLSLCES